MDIVKKIEEYTEVEFKKKLDMIVPELAEKVQYIGFEMVGSRPSLIFRTSVHEFEFRILLGSPLLESEVDKLLLRYKEMYLTFRVMKYHHLARIPLKT